MVAPSFNGGVNSPQRDPPLYSDSKYLSYAANSPTSGSKVIPLRQVVTFLLGVLFSILVFFQYRPAQSTCISLGISAKDLDSAAFSAAPTAGSTVMHPFPPAQPTNAYPTLFPSNVGFAGPTRTGDEPALVATAPAYPIRDGTCGALIGPSEELPDDLKASAQEPSQENSSKSHFNIFRSWGNLTPWFSIPRGDFGVDATPDPPDTCRVTGLHLLHRHGARYPTAGDGPASFATKLHKNSENWNATGRLSFLNEWTYKLGEEVLTVFGRKQLYDLGASMKMKYGDLLSNFTEANAIPVFRTESQDRMLSSAMNFALGFFGWPLDGKYQQSILIEALGFNNTLASYMTCTNMYKVYGRGGWYISRWLEHYLKGARSRLSDEMPGIYLDIGDIYNMQSLCAYETVALGYSKFCELFTEEEWEGFEYSMDLMFWYIFGYGSPVGRVLGIGCVQELVARLTHTPIQTHNSSTNSTLNDNPITFPLDQSIYVDATHDATIMNVLVALNLTTFAQSGPLPYDHIPEDLSFQASKLVPFATNLQFQLLDCDSTSHPGRQIRLILNDGVVPLTGVGHCLDEKHGMCPLETFIQAQKDIIQSTDWDWGCYGNWTVGEGPEWETVTGDPPSRP